MAVGWGVARTGMRMGSPRLVAGRDMPRLERHGTPCLPRAAQACSLGSHRRTRSEARDAREREREREREIEREIERERESERARESAGGEREEGGG